MFNKTWKAKQNFASNIFLIFWGFLMINQFFVAPQVKRSMIISNKLVHTSWVTICRTKRLRISENQEISGKLKTLLDCCLVLTPPTNVNVLLVLTELWWICLEYFVNDCLRKQFLASNTLHTHLNFICFIIFVNLRYLTEF